MGWGVHVIAVNQENNKTELRCQRLRKTELQRRGVAVESSPKDHWVSRDGEEIMRVLAPHLSSSACGL